MIVSGSEKLIYHRSLDNVIGIDVCTGIMVDDIL